MFQEVYGPHRYKHLRTFFRNKLSLFIKLKSSIPKDAFCKVWLKLAQQFRQSLPLGKENALYLKKLEFPSAKDSLCQAWLKLAQWFLRKEDF